MAGHLDTQDNNKISPEPIGSGDISGQIGNTLERLFKNSFTNQDGIDKIIQIDSILEENPKAYEVRLVGKWIILLGTEKTISIDVESYWGEGGADAVEEVSYDEISARHIESISTFQESIVELEVLSDAIQMALEKNDNETWENIDENDIISKGLFKGNTLVEAILVYRNKIIQSGQELRGLGNIEDKSMQELQEAREKIYNANELYLLLIMGIGETREELVHVIPKTQEECIALIGGVLDRRSSGEIIDWMKNIHAQIDENNWQSGSVEKNYLFFIQTLNVQVLEKLHSDIFKDKQSENYQKPDLLLEFAVLTSGRLNWNKESKILGYDIGTNASPVDSKLWDASIAEQALLYAMDIPTQRKNGETTNMLSTMMQNMDISDPLLEDNSPSNIVENTVKQIKESIFIENLNGESIKLGDYNPRDIDTFFENLGYKHIIDANNSRELGASYKDLTLEEMIAVSSLARIQEKLKIFDTKGPGHSKRFTGYKKVTMDDFKVIAGEAAQEATQHVGTELNKNFDDSWSEVWENRTTMRDENGNRTWHNEADSQRAEKFGLSGNPNSLEYQIFTLYNDINGNGNLGEVSDATKNGVETAGFMIAMIAGSVLIGGAAVAALRIGGIALGLASEGAIMGMTGSAMGYGMDAGLGDARGFYTPSEAIIGVATDFALGAGTGALGGPLVQKFGNPESAFLARGSLRNKGIFAGDLLALGIGPEFARIYAVNQAWHGSDIFNQNEDSHPFKGKIDDIQRSLLQYELNKEQIQAYFSKPINWEILPHGFENYRYLLQIFHGYGFESSDISLEFDRRFSKALSIYQTLHSTGSMNIIQNQPAFLETMNEIKNNRKGGPNVWKQKILKTIETWIKTQEGRLEEII